MAVSVLGPVFTAIEAGVGAAIPGELGGLVATGLEGALSGAATGAAIGGVESAITGAPIGKGLLSGAEGGALTGGAVGVGGPLLADATGIPQSIANAAVGAGTGFATSSLTGQSPVMSTLGGGLSGLLSSAGVPGKSVAGSAGAPGGGTSGGPSAAARAAPAALSDAPPPDVTQNEFSGVYTPGSDTFGGPSVPSTGGGGGGGTRVDQGFNAPTGGDIGSSENEFGGIYTPGSNNFGGQGLGGAVSPDTGGLSYPSDLPINAPSVGNVNYNDALSAAQHAFDQASLETFSPFSGSSRFLADFSAPNATGRLAPGLQGATELASVPTSPATSVADLFGDEFNDPYKQFDTSKTTALSAFGLTNTPSMATEAIPAAGGGGGIPPYGIANAGPGLGSDQLSFTPHVADRSLTPLSDAAAAQAAQSGMMWPEVGAIANADNAFRPLTSGGVASALLAPADPVQIAFDGSATVNPVTADTATITGDASAPIDLHPDAALGNVDPNSPIGQALQGVVSGSQILGGESPTAPVASTPLSPVGNVDPASPVGAALRSMVTGGQSVMPSSPDTTVSALPFATTTGVDNPAAAAAASEAGGGITPTIGVPADLSAAPAVSPTAAPASGASPVSSGGFLSGILSSPAALLAGGGLALDVLRGNQTPGGYNQILGQANQAAQRGKQLQDYLKTGQLPPGLQTSLDSARSDAEASIRSQYASRGMSGSSAEAQDLQNLNSRVVAQGSDMAMKLFQMGMSENEISAQLYQVIMQEQIQQDQELSQGISNMVTALAGMSRPLAA